MKCLRGQGRWEENRHWGFIMTKSSRKTLNGRAERKKPQATRNGPESRRSSTPPVNTNRSADRRFYLSCGVLSYKNGTSKIVFHDREKHHSGFLPENAAGLPDIHRRYLKVIYSTQGLGTFSLCLLTSAPVSDILCQFG